MDKGVFVFLVWLISIGPAFGWMWHNTCHFINPYDKEKQVAYFETNICSMFMALTWPATIPLGLSVKLFDPTWSIPKITIK